MNEVYNGQSTTEELIIAYLDGELVRKELEVELFDRLATQPDARTILREHLSVRGAIKHSMADERFQLSDDLDHRTRARLEQILKNVSAPAIEIAAQKHSAKRLADAPLATVDPAERSLRRWALRPATVALLLLLAIGGTWYLSQSTHQPAIVSKNNTPSNSPATAPTMTEPTEAPIASQTPAGIQHLSSSVTQTSQAPREPKVITRTVVKYLPAPESKNIAENNAAATSNVSNAQVEAASDPADVMLSRRAGKMLKSTRAKTIVIGEKDRINDRL